MEAFVQNPQAAALGPQDMGADTPPVLEPEYEGGVGWTTPQTPSSVPLPIPEPCPTGSSTSPPGSSLPPQKRLRSPLASCRPSQFPRRLKRVPPSSSSTAPNHAELISSLSILGDKGELKSLQDEKTREAKALYRRLKTLAGKHSILQERYGASVRRTEAVRASLEDVQAERDSAMKERDSAMRERDILRAGRDEMHFFRALERTIRIVQAELEEAELEVPSSLWDAVRGNVSSPDPPNS
ncbi:hypothetical protein LIER_19797 [Lithospermum erythrorhizon]|uniref:Uncharacterized protein n=1 Tax=Lithospermum erythrorhizon TaxID=34254 RepID=A0AAV3QK63_LITER